MSQNFRSVGPRFAQTQMRPKRNRRRNLLIALVVFVLVCIIVVAIGAATSWFGLAASDETVGNESGNGGTTENGNESAKNNNGTGKTDNGTQDKSGSTASDKEKVQSKKLCVFTDTDAWKNLIKPAVNDNCNVSDAGPGWERVRPLNVLAEKADDASLFCYGQASNRDGFKSIIKKGTDDCGGQGWTHKGIFYAYDDAGDDREAQCLKNSSDYRYLIDQDKESCDGQGWSTQHVFYAKK